MSKLKKGQKLIYMASKLLTFLEYLQTIIPLPCFISNNTYIILHN